MGVRIAVIHICAMHAPMDIDIIALHPLASDVQFIVRVVSVMVCPPSATSVKLDM